jgi:hypothetical protein
LSNTNQAANSNYPSNVNYKYNLSQYTMTDALVKQSLVRPVTLFKPLGNTKKDWKEEGK